MSFIFKNLFWAWEKVAKKTGAIGDNFPAALEVMIMKLDCIFAPFVFCCEAE